MRLTTTIINGVLIAETTPVGDNRGSFARFFCEKELSEAFGDRRIVQINYSKTSNVGVVRGMHFQNPPHAEMKMIRCIKGRVWDVALDLRSGSPTFLKYHAQELSPENAFMMILPEGCAHGFQILESDSELLYLHSEFYTPGSEGGISPVDPLIHIEWPLEINELSKRDSSHPFIADIFIGISI